MKAITLFFVALMVTLPAASFAQDAPPPSTQTEPHRQSLDQLNRELQNPVSSVWNITFQFNNYFLDGPPSDKTRVESLVNFQPVMPVLLTENLNLIVRR